MPYWRAPEGGLESPEALLPWAEIALGAARRAKAEKTPRRRGRGQR
jgi:TfoX/Sxy family transcriptional regulator of competence genes